MGHESDIPADIQLLSADLFNLAGRKFISFLEECKRQMLEPGLPDRFACAAKRMEDLVRCEVARPGDAWAKKIRPATPAYIRSGMNKFVTNLLDRLSYKDWAELFACLAKRFNDAGELYFKEGIMIKAQQTEEVVHKLSLIRIDLAKLDQANS